MTKEQLVSAAEDMRHQRMKAIYEQLVDKTGNAAAKKVFTSYFTNGLNAAETRKIEKETVKRRYDEEAMKSGRMILPLYNALDAKNAAIVPFESNQDLRVVTERLRIISEDSSRTLHSLSRADMPLELDKKATASQIKLLKKHKAYIKMVIDSKVDL